MKEDFNLRYRPIAILAMIILAAVCAAAAEDSDSFAFLISPKHPVPGGVLRVLAAGENDPGNAQIVVVGPSGRLDTIRDEKRGGGPPFWTTAEFRIEEAGSYKIALKKFGKTFAAFEIEIKDKSHQATIEGVGSESRASWNRQTENLYSAWVDALFHDANEGASWKVLHEVTRNAEMNFLHNHLGLGEDDAGRSGLVMEPDCADNPFYMRAYFAWKTGLPFGFHECNRGWIGRAPRTGRWLTNESLLKEGARVSTFNSLLRTIMNAIHSATARTKLEDDTSDYFPVPLTRKDLRPGVVYADPYGHTLTIVRWVPQSRKQPGQLLTVDAQPDGTVGIKRFWKGNFLFATAEVIGDPGFKAFRPIVREGGRLRLLTNKEIEANPDYGNISLQQKNMPPETFYDTMARLINPDPLDPERALRDLVKALHQQLIVRVESVANGEAYMKAHPGAVVPMPSNETGVFLTTGPWEDFATPNRDLRVLIAMDTILEFPDKAVRSPDLYDLPKFKSAEKVREKLRELSSELTREEKIAYVGSDGRERTLTLAEILKRRDAFEMAYNPNDSIEIRWGAPEGSPEAMLSHRRASASQVEKMRKIRVWFKKRLHPPT